MNGSELWDYVEGLAKLSGMCYASYNYTAEEWIAKTGVDPRKFREIDVRQNGLCGWSRAAESLVQERFTVIHNNQVTLGVR